MILKQAIVYFLLPLGRSRSSSHYASTLSPSGRRNQEHLLLRRHVSQARGDDAIGDVQGNKTQEQNDFIRSNIHNDIFNGELPPDALDILPTSFDRVEYEEGSTIIKQGDENADFLLLIEDGECAISIDGRALPYPYGTVGRGTLLGENSLLYGQARAATVTAKTNVSAFRQSLESFQFFMNIVETEDEKEDVRAELLEIDRVIDKISGVRTAYGGNVIKKFEPSRWWLWRQWKGTILAHAWKPAFFNMLVTTGFIICLRSELKPSWAFGTLPSKSNPVISRILGLNCTWKYMMSITTFILTFFLSQAYNLWRDIYTTARVIQGRLSDINLLLTCCAKRNKFDGKFTSKAANVLEDVASYTRLFHAFTWASHSRKMKILLNPQGMRRLTCRGYMTQKECEILSSLESNVQPQHACLVWIVTRILKGMKDGDIADDHVLRHEIFSETTQLQGASAGVGAKLAGRIQLAYAHFVQILVDSFLAIAPFALYGEVGFWSVPAVGILTLFYSGMLDLSKILLDPLDNDEFYNNANLNMDLAVIIRESNAGSTRWMAGGQSLPF